MKDFVINYLKDGSELTAWVMIIGYCYLVGRGIIILIKGLILVIKEEWNK